MKKLIMTAAILGLTATGAAATDQDITLNATVTSFCSLNGSTANGSVATPVSIAVAGGVPGAVTAGSNTFAVVCNASSNVSLSSLNQGLTTGGSATAPFANKINYTATASGFAAGTLNTASAATTGNIGVTGASATDLTVDVTAPALPSGTSYLVPGSYTDTLTVRVVPQ